MGLASRKVTLHVSIRPNLFGLGDVERLCENLVEFGLCEEARAYFSEERDEAGLRTAKITVEGLPAGRVPPHRYDDSPWYEERPALSHIRERIRDNLGKILGTYRG